MSTSTDRMDNVLSELKLPRTHEARRVAKCGYEDNFDRRRGAFEDDGSGVVRLFDNNPYPSRDGQIRQLARWLTDHGHEIVGAASYPARGASIGYTLGIIVRYHPGRTFDAVHEQIFDAWSAIRSATLPVPPRTAWDRVSEPSF